MAWDNSFKWTGAVLSLAAVGLYTYAYIRYSSQPCPGDIECELDHGNDQVPVQLPRLPPNPDRRPNPNDPNHHANAVLARRDGEEKRQEKRRRST